MLYYMDHAQHHPPREVRPRNHHQKLMQHEAYYLSSIHFHLFTSIVCPGAAQRHYMTGTGGGLWKSSDLEVWTYLGFPLQFNEAAWMGASPQVWASEIHCIDGKYYNFSTLTNGNITIDSDGHPRRAVHIMSSTLPEMRNSIENEYMVAVPMSL